MMSDDKMMSDEGEMHSMETIHSFSVNLTFLNPFGEDCHLNPQTKTKNILNCVVPVEVKCVHPDEMTSSGSIKNSTFRD